MMNTLCGTMGSTKSETSSYTKLKQPTSPNESDSKRSMTISNCEIDQKSLNPPSLNFPPIKSELDADAEVQSPDNSGWETFFSDHLDTDFMILSPVRNFPSPQASCYNYINYVNSMQGQSASGCSPPRYLSQIGSYKGKGLSPLHKVFNSPNNQYMQVENLSLPGIENDFLDQNIGGFGGSYQPTKLSSVTSNGSTQMFDSQNTVPEMLDYFGTQNASRSSGGSQLTNDKDIYNQMGSLLQHELHQDQQPTSSTATTLGSAGSSVQHNQQRHDVMMPFPMGSEQEEDSGLQLVHLLLECAKAVAEEDYMVARRYLHQLNQVVTPLGDSMQRVASCFTEALTARLASTLTTKLSTSSTTKPFSPFPPNCMEILKIYQILYQACPYIKFAHFTANQAIFEAFEAEKRVHVIDLDILQGYQWPAFMQALAARPNGAPFLRITGVGSSIEGVKETGRCLTELAHSLHIPFEFHPVAEELEDLKPFMFNRRVGEALAVNSVNRLHRVPGNYLGPLLAMIRDQAPNIVTIVEQEASHNGQLFLSRFLEALHYYSAIFDSLDATFPPESAQRAKVEQYIFAPEIRNIVACEGVERTARHEKLEKWKKIMEGKGFKGVALSGNAVTQSKILLGLYSCDGYTLREDKGCLLLGWQDRAILAASAWRC